MNPNNIIECKYCNWICKNRINRYLSYKKLFEFSYIMPNDETLQWIVLIKDIIL